MNLTYRPFAAFAARSDTLCNADTRAFALAGSTFISLIVMLKGAADLAGLDRREISMVDLMMF
jgi:hypothetical protein